VTGDLLGGHAVEIVGYSDADQCWICKNSWGTRWGENGFFRIGYGQCRIDSGIDPFSFYGIEGVTLPSPLNIDWYDRTVFDVDFYVRYQSDFQAVFGDDPDNARNHWLQHGIKEGRRGSREFDVKFYIDNNDDVKAAFGADYPSVFNQWYRHGMKEGRRGSREFDVKFYIDNNDDIKAAFGNNYVAAIDHWIKTGLPIEGRRGSEEFDVKFYLNHNHDLQVAFGNNYVAAIDHWIKTGSSEHRTGAP
jgi:hypothetical protein